MILVRGGRTSTPASEQVQVSEGRTSQVRIQLTTPLFIAGTVVDESGAPLHEASVNARAEGGGDGRGWARTNKDGVYRLEGLPPGTYRVSVWCNGYQTGVLKGVQAGEANVRFVLKKQ
jgi:protocatechuate 3,4-dioxygenase beta subunit